MSVLTAFSHLDAAADGQLLGRFVQSRDADAFAALVRRLGPTVLAVCRRVCPDAHLAEDAFQAAFLVLARKADSVRPREKVAVWLHGVAYRTAAKARSLLAARRRRETASPTLPETPVPEVAVTDDDTLRRLDAAIAALPERLRGPVVLCELDGRSRKEAATRLGIPEGTLSSRLAEARKRLGDRLRPTVAAAVSLTLAARTAEAAVSGVASETVLTLARGAMTMMLVQKLKFPTLVGLAMLTFAAAGTVLLSVPPVQSAPVPKVVKPAGGRIGVTKGGVLYLLNPDGKATHEFDVEEEWKLEWLEGPCRVCPSPNGGFPVAVLVPREKDEDKRRGIPPRHELRLIRSPDDSKGEVVKVEEKLSGELVWSRSGKRFYVSTRADKGSKDTYLAVDPTTGKATAVAVPEGHRLVGEAPDGTLVTVVGVELGRAPKGEHKLYRVSADGKAVETLKPLPWEGRPGELDLSPDGRTVLTRAHDPDTASDRLVAFDTATGGTTAIAPKGLDGVRVGVRQVRWSPDGKRVGFVYQRRDQKQRLTDAVLYVCDADGTNGQAICEWRVGGETFGEVWDAHFEWN